MVKDLQNENKVYLKQLLLLQFYAKSFFNKYLINTIELK